MLATAQIQTAAQGQRCIAKRTCNNSRNTTENIGSATVKRSTPSAEVSVEVKRRHTMRCGGQNGVSVMQKSSKSSVALKGKDNANNFQTHTFAGCSLLACARQRPNSLKKQ